MNTYSYNSITLHSTLPVPPCLLRTTTPLMITAMTITVMIMATGIATGTMATTTLPA